MGHRLTKIYTRTGDEGTTGLGDGSRINKASLRVSALGDVDELNSVIGVLLCEELPVPVRELLTGVQHDLFDLGGETSNRLSDLLFVLGRWLNKAGGNGDVLWQKGKHA